jgi:hypothetical protein
LNHLESSVINLLKSQEESNLDCKKNTEAKCGLVDG